jgi:hypothetical protein
VKKRLQVIAIALAAAGLLFLVGFLILPDSSINNKPIIPVENAKELYEEALPTVSEAQDMTLNISKTQEITVGSEVFLETSQQKLAYTGLGTEDIRASVTETLSIDDFSVNISEIYYNGTGYVSINDSRFFSSISKEDYLKRFAPAQLLDPALYGIIDGIDNGYGYVINFSQPAAAEAWALSEDGLFVDAKGSAYVNYDGQLTKSIYNLTYNRGKIQFKMTYVVDVALSSDEISIPNNRKSYISIDYLDGPRMLEHASGYLLQAANISAHYTDSIYFQAFGDARTQDITLHTAKGESFSALVQTVTTLKNDGRVGLDSQLKKTELFVDNRYSVSTDDADPVVNKAVTADDMYNYFHNVLVGTIMLPAHITGAQIVDNEETLRIQYSASDAFAVQISANACQSLYQEPELLNDLSQSRTTDTLQCYLELDKTTGLPIASGISYSGTHTIENVPYSLRYQADQIYDILTQSAQEEINKAAE